MSGERDGGEVTETAESCARKARSKAVKVKGRLTNKDDEIKRKKMKASHEMACCKSRNGVY
jgi:allophanate hydrolase subunit 2